MRQALRLLPAIGLAFVVLAGCSAPAQDAKEVRRTVPLAADGRVTLDTEKGRVEITTWDQPSVEIYARIEPDGFASDRREQVESTQVRIDASASSVRIKSDYSRLDNRRWFRFGCDRPSVHYSIQMPRTARLQVRDHRSEIRVGDLRGELHLNTYRGTAVVSSVEGPMRLETYRGRIRVDSARLAGRCRADTYRGEIELGIPRNRGFSLDADLGRRASLLGSYGVRAGEGRHHGARRVSDSFNGGGPTLQFKTYRGTLRLNAV